MKLIHVLCGFWEGNWEQSFTVFGSIDEQLFCDKKFCMHYLSEITKDYVHTHISGKVRHNMIRHHKSGNVDIFVSLAPT